MYYSGGDDTIDCAKTYRFQEAFHNGVLGRVITMIIRRQCIQFYVMLDPAKQLAPMPTTWTHLPCSLLACAHTDREDT